MITINNSQKQFLPHRIANVWNSLPAADTDFTNLISFRASMQNITYTHSRDFSLVAANLRSFFVIRAHVRDHARSCLSFELAHCFYLFYIVLNFCFVQFNKNGLKCGFFDVGPISSSRSISALGFTSGWYRHSVFICGPIWKQPCDNL